MPRAWDIQRLRALPANLDGLALNVDRQLLALKFIAKIAQVGMFLIEILHIESEIGYAPGDLFVVSDNHAGHPGQRHTGHMQIWRLDADRVPGGREGPLQMGIV